MGFVLGSVILNYFLTSSVIGIAIFSALKKMKIRVNPVVSFLFLFNVFMLIDCYYRFFFGYLDLTITVGNPLIAKFLEIKPDTAASLFFGFGTTESVIWISQALIGCLVGSFFQNKKNG